jgi:hypothetical protein
MRRTPFEAAALKSSTNLDVVKLSIKLLVVVPVDRATTPSTVGVASIPDAEFQARHLK